MKSEIFWKLLAISIVLLMVASVVGAVNMTMNSTNRTENETLNSEELSDRDASSVPINNHPKMSTQVLKHLPPSGIAAPATQLLLNIYLTENKTEYIEKLKSYTIGIWYVEDYTVVAEVYTTEIERIADLPFVSYINIPVPSKLAQSEMQAASEDVKKVDTASSVPINRHPKMSTQVLKHIPPPGIAPSDEPVLVNIYLINNKTEYIDELKKYTIDIWYAEQYTVVAEVYTTEIERIADLPFVSYINTPVPSKLAQFEMSNVSEMTKLLGMDNNAIQPGIEDVKIVIPDFGFDGYAKANLPTDVIPLSFRHDGNISGGNYTGPVAHGTACAEVVHAIAPDAKLYLVSYYLDLELRDALKNLTSEVVDIDIISHSIGGYVGQFNGNDWVCRNVIDPAVDDHGIIWVNSAGNDAQRHWEGTFKDTDGDGWHEFPCTGGEMGQKFYANKDDYVTLCLSWNDTWWFATEDYNLYIANSRDEIVGTKYINPGWSEIRQDGFFFDHPYEVILDFMAPYTGDYYIKIHNFSARRPVHFELYSFYHDLSCKEENSSLNTHATAFRAIVAGAVDKDTLELENYSSRGPTNDGRIKPDFVAPVGYDTSVYEDPFCGTSAAAPHVAANIASYLAYIKNLPGQPDNQSAYELFKPCLDEIANTTEKDNQYGYGLPNFSICYP